jgi:hypothetical protein
MGDKETYDFIRIMDKHSDCSNRRTEDVQSQQGQEGRSRSRRAGAGTGGQQQGQEGRSSSIGMQQQST